MAEQTAIEWCDHTFNPWTGCTKVSPGCDGCYAERWSKRSGAVVWGPGAPRRRTTPANWRKPLQWNAAHEAFFAAHGRRQRVFCASLADVFDNEVPDPWRWDLFRLIAATPHLDWLLLTKRIGNARAMLNSAAAAVAGEFVGALEWDRAPWPNVWLGATVVNQAEADRDIPKLLQVPARVRFLSIEPMLGPIDLRHLLGGVELRRGGAGFYFKALDLHWIICGGESGPGARPVHPDWFRSLRDQCASAGVAFMLKQWGEWTDERHVRLDQPIATRLRKTVSRLAIDGTVYPMHGPGPESYSGIYRVGKKAAGRLLDGVQHDGFPEVER